MSGIDSKEIIVRLQEVRSVSQKEIADKVFGISPSNLCQQIKRNRLNLYKLVDYCLEYNISLDWLFRNKGSRYWGMEEHLREHQQKMAIESIPELTSKVNRLCNILKDQGIISGDLLEEDFEDMEEQYA